jgi:hypothetical protein
MHFRLCSTCVYRQNWVRLLHLCCKSSLGKGSRTRCLCCTISTFLHRRSKLYSHSFPRGSVSITLSLSISQKRSDCQVSGLIPICLHQLFPLRLLLVPVFVTVPSSHSSSLLLSCIFMYDNQASRTLVPQARRTIDQGCHCTLWTDTGESRA